MARILDPTIGQLIQTTPNDPHFWDDYIGAFQTAVLTPKTSITYITQTGVDYASYLTGAQNLMAAGADVIVTAGKVAAQACYAATNANHPANPIPIVVASAGDLEGLTGGNLTGCTNGQQDAHILNSRIAKMRQVLNPTAVAVVGHHAVTPVGNAMDYVQTQLGLANGQVIDLNPTNFQTRQDVLGILTNLKQQFPSVDVLFVCSDPFLRTKGDDLVQVAHGHGLGMRTMHEFAEWHDRHQGDLCYGPNFKILFQRAAGYVDQILNGALPANLPVFAPQLVDCIQWP